MKTIVTILLILYCYTFVSAFKIDQELFESFIKKYHRQYRSENEYQERFKIFQDNLISIEQLQQNELGTAKYGVNKFSDRTKDEIFFNLKLQIDQMHETTFKSDEQQNVENIPESYDWRDHGAVTSVKNQLSCGSCWAFSAVGNIEGLYALKYGELVSFSAQELVDCQNERFSCMTGGWPYDAYFEITNLGGLETDEDYPYGGVVFPCHVNSSKIRVELNGGMNLTSNEDELAKWLVENGPISVTLNATVLASYESGIIHPLPENCNPYVMDHCVLLVGYGQENDVPYWIVKNSWGADWGEDGYFRIYRGDGSCGINTFATTAIIV